MDNSLFGELNIYKATLQTDNVFDAFGVSKTRLAKMLNQLAELELANKKTASVSQAAHSMLQMIWNEQPDFSFQEKVVISFLLGKWVEQFKAKGGVDLDTFR